MTGAAEVGRRGGTAYDRLVAETKPADVVIGFLGTTSGADRVTALPQVTDSWPFRAVVGRVAGDQVGYRSVFSAPPPPAGRFGLVLEEGRLPTGAGEVLVNADVPDVARPGASLGLDLLTQQDFDAFSEGFGDPHGPHVDLRVVGVARTPGVDASISSLIATPDFFTSYAAGAGGGDGVAVRLRRGVADAPALQRELVGLFPVPPGADASFEPFRFTARAAEQESVARSSSVAVRGLVAFAVVAGIAGALALVQACTRHMAAETRAQPTLAALGAGTGVRLASLVAPGGLSAILAAVVATAGGMAASHLAPMGSARHYEPHPGPALNIGVVALGALATAAFCLLCLALAASRVVSRKIWTPDRLPGRTSVVVARLTSLGPPPPAAVGSRFALAPGSGGRPGPARMALAATVLGVAGAVGAIAVAGTLGRLTSSPDRFGEPGEASVSDVRDDTVAGLVADRRVAGVLDVQSGEVLIDGRPTAALTARPRKGSIDFHPLSGRLPRSSDEVALGPTVLNALKRHSGDRVTLGQGDTSRSAVVVGEVLAVGGALDKYDESALLPQETFDRFRRSEPARQAYVTWAPGVDRSRASAELGRGLEVDDLQSPPTRIAQLGQIRGLLSVLALFLALLGVIALAHAVLSTERHRRRELAVLRAVGFTPGQAVRTLASMALVVVAIGAAVGTPLGLVAANIVWRALAASVHVSPGLRLPGAVLLLAPPAALVVALVAAALPAWRAGHLEVASVLRAE